MVIHPIADVSLEEVILSHVFSEGSVIDHKKLKPSLFSLPRNKSLYEVLKKLRQQGEPLTADAVKLEQPELEEVARRLSLRRLGDVTSATVIKKLCDMAKRREMQDVAANIAEAAISSDDPSSSVSEQLNRLMAVEETGEEKLSRAGDMQEVIDLLQFRADNPGVLRGMSTGFCKLDKFIDGMNTGLFTVAGATGEGKSSFAMNMAINVAKGMRAAGDDSNVLYFAMEMPAIEMKLRMVSCLSGTPFNSGGMTYEEMRLLKVAIDEMSKLNILFDESGHPSIDFIVNRARKLHREKKLKLIVSDYAQLIKVPKSRGNDASDLNFVSKALQALSMELGIPIVNVAMLKRAEKQWDKYKKEWFTPPPSLGDVSGSAGFENDSVVVAMLQRDADNNTKIYLPKNRHGPRNVSVDLRFEAAIYRFTEK